MNAEETAEKIFRFAGWSFDADEFRSSGGKLHTVLLDPDMTVNFISVSRSELLVWVPIFILPEDQRDRGAKLRHFSSLVTGVNFEYPVGSAVVDGSFRLELLLQCQRYEFDQLTLLLQRFLDDCERLSGESVSFDQQSRGMFNNIPVNFLIN